MKLTGLVILILHILIILFGAMAGSLKRVREMDNFTKLDLAYFVFVSVFAGIIFGLSALYLFSTEEYIITLIMSGIGAYTGPKGIELLSDTIKGTLVNMVKKIDN